MTTFKNKDKNEIQVCSNYCIYILYKSDRKM